MEIEVKSEDIDHIQTAFNEIPFYKKYYPMLKDKTHASDPMLYATMQFNLGMSLENAWVESELGIVRPSTAFIIIERSGSSKTLALDIAKTVRTELSHSPIYHIQKFEHWTPEGVKSFLANLSGEEKQKLYRIALFRDEATTLIKQMKRDSSEQHEFLNDLIDGRVEQHDTRTSGHETMPEQIKCDVLVAGTPPFWRHATSDWWDTGTGYRLFYPPEGKPDFRGIRMNGSSFAQFSEFTTYLKTLPSITKFEYTPEFDTRYYSITEQNRVKLFGTNENPIAVYRTKFPVLILKLAMIHKAAMMEKPKAIPIPNSMSQENYLLLDTDDLEWAVKDFEYYSRGFGRAYDSFIDAQSDNFKPKTTKDSETQFFSKLDKIKEHYEIHHESDPEFSTNSILVAEKSETGEWYTRTALNSLLQWSGETWDAITGKLIKENKIEMCHPVWIKGTRHKDSYLYRIM